VLGARHGLGSLGVESPRAHLPVEIAVGAVAYVGATLAVARPSARDLLQVLGRALRRGG
jgi:hypothetical protein